MACTGLIRSRALEGGRRLELLSRTLLALVARAEGHLGVDALQDAGRLAHIGGETTQLVHPAEKLAAFRVHEAVDHRRVAFHLRQVERGEVGEVHDVAVGEVHVPVPPLVEARAVFEEKRQRGHVGPVNCRDDRRVAVAVGAIDLRAVVEESASDVELLALKRVHERNHPRVARDVRVELRLPVGPGAHDHRAARVRLRCSGCSSRGGDAELAPEDLAHGVVGVDVAWRGEGVDEVGYDKANPARELVKIDPKYFRPTEVELLIGDPTKAKQKLGWTPKVKMEELCREMVEADIKLVEKGDLTS